MTTQSVAKPTQVVESNREFDSDSIPTPSPQKRQETLLDYLDEKRSALMRFCDEVAELPGGPELLAKYGMSAIPADTLRVPLALDR